MITSRKKFKRRFGENTPIGKSKLQKIYEHFKGILLIPQFFVLFLQKNWRKTLLSKRLLVKTISLILWLSSDWHPLLFFSSPFHPLWEVKLQITSHQRAPTIQSLCWRNVYWRPWLGYNCEQSSSFSRRQLGPTFLGKREISGQNNDLHLFQILIWISQQSSSISRRQPTFSESVWESSFSFATTFRGVCRNLHNLA